MRIYKKRPFSAPNSVKVNTLSAQLDRVEATRRDLADLRERIANGKMSNELYDFINMDGSLERVLGGLPRPVEGTACEALTSSQLMFIDAALEDVSEKKKSLVAAIWAAFKEWILDWWDVNRHVRKELRSMRAEFKINPSVYGDISSFGRVMTNVYHKTNWLNMVSACAALEKIIKTVPKTDLEGWVNTNLDDINKNLREFGQTVVEPGLRIHQDNPAYDKNYMTLNAAQWRFQLIGMDLDKVIDLLDDDIESRRLIDQLEQTFVSADPVDHVYLGFIRYLVMKCKSNSFVLASAIRRMLVTVRSTVKNGKTDAVQ